MLQTLIVLGSVAHFLATLTYVRNAFLGRSQPNRVTFLLWGLIPIIAVAIGLKEGATWALVPVFMAGLGPFLIFLASFFNTKAYWKLGSLDYACGALAIIAIALWLFTEESSLAVLFSILADALALFPTLVKAWNHPESETGIPYIVAFVTEVVAVFAVTEYSIPEFGFLAYLILANIGLIICVYRKGLLRKLRSELAP
jgi:hypothetical protein